MLHRLTASISKKIHIQHIRGIASRDAFGSLSERGSMRLELEATQKLVPDDAIGYDHEERDIVARRNAYYYKYEISNHARKGKLGIKRALELFKEMKSVARLEPSVENFSPLIYGCAKSGYTQKAFELYQEFLNYHNKPTNSIVTCLINSCGESPFREYGMKRLEWLLQHLRTQQCRELNKIQYHAAIKAYGKLGDIKQASNLVSEMIKKNMMPGVETFNMLLIGCVSDRESGTTLALKVFKRMKQYGISPDINTYNLLLRCIRDCKMGSQALMLSTLKELPALSNIEIKLKNKRAGKNFRNNLINSTEWLPMIKDLGPNLSVDVESNINESAENTKLLESGAVLSTTVSNRITKWKCPSLLEDDHLMLYNQIQSLDAQRLLTPMQRFQLFGGMHGFLESMTRDKCKPDCKTLSLMLACIPSDRQDVLELFRLGKDYQVSYDRTLYNLWVRYICSSRNPQRLELALQFIDLMGCEGFRPDIESFEALAFGCDTWHMAHKLMNDIENCGFVVSHTILDRFFLVGSRNYNFLYLTKLIYHTSCSDYQPTKEVVQGLDEVRIKAYETIVDHECNRLSKTPHWLTSQQVEQFETFKMRLSEWLKKVKIRQDSHPWLQFYVPNESKKRGFKKFVKDMRLMIESKR